MKKLLLLLTLSLGFVSCLQAQDIPKLDSLMNYYVDEYNFNGVALVAQHGKVIYEQTFGYRDMNTKKQMTEKTIFPIGTLTTQFTAEIILQYAAEHKLNLDDKLKKYLPNYPKGDSLTINNLLTNTSGVFDYMMMANFTNKFDTIHIPKDSLLKLFQKRPLAGEPGKKFRYSTANYVLLGYVIEAIANKSYYEVVRERIFKPVGMTHSGFDFRALRDTNKAAPYKYFDDVAPLKQEAYDSTLLFAAGAAYSTAADLYLWDKALYSGKLLSKEWQQKTFTAHMNKYAMGWVIDTIAGKTAAGLAAVTQGFSGYYYHIPEDSTCVILLQNIKFPAYDDKSEAASIVSCLEDKDYKVPQPVPAITVSADKLHKYEGIYVFGSATELTISLSGSVLRGHAKDGVDYDLIPIGKDLFKTKSLHATLEFVIGPDGTASKILIHEVLHERTMTGTRKQPKK